jgi:hypothetical protein
MSFLAPLLGGLVSGGLGMLGMNQANSATINAQNQAQQNAANTAANSTAAAKQSQQQALQQALSNLAQYQQSNPSPISQLGAIQGPSQSGAQQSFGGGVQGSQAPQQQQQMQMPQGMQRQQPQQMPQQQPQQNLQGAVAGQSPGTNQPPQQPPGQDFSRLQQLSPLVQQMLQGQRTPQPMGRSSGGAM